MGGRAGRWLGGGRRGTAGLAGGWEADASGRARGAGAAVHVLALVAKEARAVLLGLIPEQQVDSSVDSQVLVGALAKLGVNCVEMAAEALLAVSMQLASEAVRADALQEPPFDTQKQALWHAEGMSWKCRKQRQATGESMRASRETAK